MSQLKALAHPARLRIAAMLRGGELCVCQMTAVVQLAASTVSAHLAELRRASCIAERKEGRWVFYTLSRQGEALLTSLTQGLGDDPQIAADAAVVAKLRAIGPEELCRVDLDLRRLGLDRAAERAR